jgi:hypothetical protein
VVEVIEKWSEVKWSEVKWSEVKWSEVNWIEIKLYEESWIVVNMWRLWSGSEVEWMEGHGEVQVQQFLTMRISLLLLFSV